MNDSVLRAAVCAPEVRAIAGHHRVRLLPPAALPLRAALRMQDLRLAQEMSSLPSLRESVWLVTGEDERVWDWTDADIAAVFDAWLELAARRPSLSPGQNRTRGGKGGRAENPYTMLLADLMHCYGGDVCGWLNCPAGLAVELGFEVRRLQAGDIKSALDAGIAAQGHQMRKSDYQQFVRALQRALEDGAAVEPLSPETNLRNAELIGFKVIRTEAGDD